MNFEPCYVPKNLWLLTLWFFAANLWQMKPRVFQLPFLIRPRSNLDLDLEASKRHRKDPDHHRRRLGGGRAQKGGHIYPKSKSIFLCFKWPYRILRLQFRLKYTIEAHFHLQDLHTKRQRTLTYFFVNGNITVQLTSCLTGLDLINKVYILPIKHKQSSCIQTGQV